MIVSVLIMILVLIIYILLYLYFPLGDFAGVIGTCCTIIGAFAIWFQLKREKDLKEAEFIMSYNTIFIENDNFCTLEHQLELFKKEYDNLIKKCTNENELNKLLQELNEKYEDIVNDTNVQVVVNYLVYHEALAALIKKGVLQIKTIDPLFNYRFFLIVNNPIVQSKELCADYLYYRGCFWLYKQWSNFHKDKNLPILLDKFALENTNEYKTVNKTKKR